MLQHIFGLQKHTLPILLAIGLVPRTTNVQELSTSKLYCVFSAINPTCLIEHFMFYFAHPVIPSLPSSLPQPLPSSSLISITCLQTFPLLVIEQPQHTCQILGLTYFQLCFLPTILSMMPDSFLGFDCVPAPLLKLFAKLTALPPFPVSGSSSACQFIDSHLLHM